MTTVMWAYKLRTSKSQIAGYLLRFLGLRIHQAQASSMILHNLAGVLNIMADIISPDFKQGQFLLASQNGLVPYLNKQSPLTQNESWTECHVPKYQVSCMIDFLHGKLQPMASLLRRTPSAINTGTIGQTMQQPRASTHSLTSKFLPKNVTLLQ